MGHHAVGLFATEGGLFYGGGFAKLGIQLLGIVSVAAWVLATMFIIFTVIKKTIGLRVSEKEEIDGWITTSTAWPAPMQASPSMIRPTPSWT